MYLRRPYLVSKVTSSQGTRAEARLQKYRQQLALFYGVDPQGSSRTCRPENLDRVVVCGLGRWTCYRVRLLSSWPCSVSCVATML